VKIVNDVTGKDYGWFFDAYLLPGQAAGTDPDPRRRRPGAEVEDALGQAFPMPVEVKVGGKIVTLPMADNTGRVKVGDAVPVIVDPASKILRRQPYVEQWQAWKKAKDDAAKAEAEAKKKAEEAAKAAKP
jgi:hypothetical protein